MTSNKNLYTLAEGIMISVRSLQRSEGDISEPIKYIHIFLKEIISSVFFDIFSYTIGNIIFCIFKNFELNLIKIGRL